MGPLHLAVCVIALVVLVSGAPDNRGTEFVIGYTANYVLNRPVELYITTSRTTQVSVKVTAPKFSTAGLNEQFVVTAGYVHQLKISNKIRAAGSELSTKGILVQADDEVVVYGTNIETYSNDAFLAFPTDVLGKEYYTVSHYPTTRPCEFMVVGVYDNTRVEITLGGHSSIEINYGGKRYYKNNKIVQTMHRYSTLQLQTYGDLTGSYITGDKNIVVMSGNERTSVKPGTSRDTLVDQMLPVDAWGKKFALVSTPARTTGDSTRFIGSKDGTSVTIKCASGYSKSFTVNAGTFAVYVTPSKTACLIESSEAIMVVLIVLSQQSSSEPADPALITIPPMEQYGADYSFATPKYSYGEYTNHFMFIVKDSEKTGLKANGKAFPTSTTYTKIPGTEYVGGSIVLQPGTHTLRHDSPISIFGGFMYGTAKYETYGMPTGLRLAPINKICVPTTQTVGDGFDNDCDGLIDEELCTSENKGKDDDGDGVAEEDCATPPPINGVWGSWSAWGTCSVSCASGLSGGTYTKTRACDSPAPKYDGTQCSGSAAVTASCTVTTPCPIDGGWTSWGSYGSCSVTCASGTKTKSRSCTNPTPQHNGQTCSGSTTSSTTCNTGVNCPIDGGLSSWSTWGTCSVTCGGGSSQRTRSCSSPAPQYGGASCAGSTSESKSCNTAPCPIDGGWASWTTWTSCPVTCGSGRIYRSRTCTNPAPAHSGADCVGSSDASTSCVLGNCPIDGDFTDWTQWSTCTVTCGGGSSDRARTCTDPVPAHGGANCTGATGEQKTCNTANCPIDGGVTAWSSWSACGITCGNATVTRTRTCTNPTPQYGGADCTLALSETIGCFAGIYCPIDGDFTTWTAWDTCTVTCAGGTQGRTRTCTNPTPQFNGADCVGDLSESQACNTQNCPIDGDWTDWTAWSACSSTCGPGEISRDRTCTNPPAQYGGAGCFGDFREAYACNGSCTVHGNWGDWGSWTSCTATCDGGRWGRVRLCDDPAPTPDGFPCFGNGFEMALCNTQTCSGQTNYGNSTSGNGTGSSQEAVYVNQCPSGFFTCRSGRIGCILEEYRCNCEYECSDESDEQSTWASCSATLLMDCGNGAIGMHHAVWLGILLAVLSIFWTR